MSLVQSQLVSLEFFIDVKSFRSYYGPGVDSSSNRNEYQEHFLGSKDGRCVRLTTLPPSCAVVMKSGNLNFPEPSGPLQACNGTALTFTFKKTRSVPNIQVLSDMRPCHNDATSQETESFSDIAVRTWIITHHITFASVGVTFMEAITLHS